jgi:hypothetical protein
VKPIDVADRAHDLRASGMMGRFLLVGIGVWLHAADSLVTATIAPAIALDLDKASGTTRSSGGGCATK